MQTFLPFPDFERSAAVLDSPRLGKQRVETLQVLRALNLPDYGWGNHPAVAMWRGRTPALVAYGLACVRQWTGRGHSDSTQPLITEFAPEVVDLSQDELGRRGLLPSWLGDEAVHASHRAALVRKDPAFYRPRLGDDVSPDVDYQWPGADDLPVAQPPAGCALWVIRPATAEVLGRFLLDGVVGLGTASGLIVDVRGIGRADLRAALRRVEPRRRPGKALRQLESFVHDIEPGDDVAVPVEADQALLTGRVTGGYAFDSGSGPPVHRRPVAWGGRLRRADLLPPAALQDPRELFRVTVSTAAMS